MKCAKKKWYIFLTHFPFHTLLPEILRGFNSFSFLIYFQFDLFFDRPLFLLSRIIISNIKVLPLDKLCGTPAQSWMSVIRGKAIKISPISSKSFLGHSIDGLDSNCLCIILLQCATSNLLHILTELI